LALFPIGFGAVGSWYFATENDTQTLRETAGFTGLCLVFVLFGIYMAASTIRSKLSLEENVISISGVFRTRSIRKSDIAGRRVSAGYNGSPATLVFMPSHPGIKKLKIPRMFATDAAFDAWLADIPDFDAADAARITQERVRSEAEIAYSTALSGTREQRLARLQRARSISMLLNVVAPVLYLWCIVYPQPYIPVVTSVAALPWLAILLAAVPNSLFRLAEKPGDAHPNLVQLLILPGLALTLRAVLDFDVIAWVPAVLPAAIVGIVTFFAAIMGDRDLRARPKAWPVILLPILAYGFGAALLGNALLDRAPSETFATTVTGHHVSSGRHTTWYVRLAPWGPYSDEEDASVPRWLYQSVADGQPVCAQLHSGAFAIRWFAVGGCPAGFLVEQHARSLRQRAEAGDRIAQNELGAALLNGVGMPRDAAVAAQWFHRAADQSCGPAGYNLGVMYQYGTGVPRDLAAAAHWFGLSEEDYPPSAAAMGYMCEMGLGVTSDPVEARQHYESAALRGNLNGQENLATMYAMGRGGPIDRAQAFRWYMEAAGQGSLRGMNGVGYSYLEGLGTAQDPAKGFAWLLAAAQAGQPNAMHTIGGIYLSGAGRTPAAAEAYRWLSLAVRGYSEGDEKRSTASIMRDQAAAQLSEQQRAEINAAVAVWKPSAPQLPDAN
jgi:TPR repeat protein